MSKSATALRARAGVLVLLLGLAAGPAWAAQARLRGTVTDVDGKPVQGVEVALASEAGGTRLTTRTDRQGAFRLLIVDPTHPPYVLHLEKEGFQPLQEEVELTANDATTFEAVLAPAEAPAPEAGPGEAAGDPEAVERFNEAAALYNQGAIADAVSGFEAAVALDPSLAPAYRILAELYLSLDRRDEALAAAERVLELEPGDAEATLVRYDALVGLGREGEARDALADLVERGEPAEAAKRLYNLAAHAQQEGDDDQALGLFRQAVELDRGLAPAWSSIAAIELTQKRPARAIEAATELLSLRPGDTEALTVLYEAYKLTGERAKADEVLARMESASDDPGVLYRRGVALFNAGSYDQAVAALRQALAGDPDLAGAHYTLGLALVNQGDAGGAREHLRRFLDLAPEHPEAETARQMLAYLDAS